MKHKYAIANDDAILAHVIEREGESVFVFLQPDIPIMGRIQVWDMENKLILEDKSVIVEKILEILREFMVGE